MTRDLETEVRRRTASWLPADLLSRLDVAETFSSEAKRFAKRNRLPASRWRHIADRIITRLESLSPVSVAPSKSEAKAGRITRYLPARCDFELAPGLVNGGFVRGNDSARGVVFARLASRHLVARGYPPCAIALLLLSLSLLFFKWQLIIVAVPFCLALLSHRRSGWVGVNCLLFALLASSTAVVVYLVPYLARSGLQHDLFALVATAVAVGLLAALFLFDWNSRETRACYGFRYPDSYHLAEQILTWRERLVSGVFRWRNAVVALLLCGLAWLYWHGQELSVRAEVARLADSRLVAHDLFAKLASAAETPREREESSRRSAAELLSAIERYSKRGSWHDTYDLLLRLESYTELLSDDERSRSAAALYAAGDALAVAGASPGDWPRSRRLFGVLVDRFPESMEARRMQVRSDWRLASVKSVRLEERLLGYKVPVEQRKDVEEDLVWHVAGPDKIYVLVTLELAHLGNTRKTLLSSSIGARVDGRRIPSLGIVKEEGLAQYKRYPGTRIGPDMATAEVVFEVPRTSRELFVEIDGRQRTRVAYAPRHANSSSKPDISTAATIDRARLSPSLASEESRP